MKKILLAIMLLLPASTIAATTVPVTKPVAAPSVKPIQAPTLPPLKQKTVALPNAVMVKKVEDYLNSLKTMTADFVQVTQSGEPAGGRFYLQRPGKFRWEYLKGAQILIISNGKEIVYYDRKLDELTYIPQTYGPMGFLAQENVKLSGDLTLLEISDKGPEIRAAVTQTKKPEEGKLILYFAKYPMKLTKMEVVDADRNYTSVIFANQKTNQPIAADLFVFKNPRLYKNVWEKK